MSDHAVFHPIYDHEVLDVHHHIGSAVGSLGWSGRNETPPSLEVERQGRLEVMNAGGVRQAIIQPAHNYLRPNGIADTRKINDEVASYRDAQPDRFPVALGVVQPQDGPLALEEIDRMSVELGLAGVSFHTLLQGVSVDSAFVHMTMERLGERGMLPFVHAVTSNPLEALWRVGAVARSFPDLQILVVDALSDFASTIECFTVADQAPNLIFDTTFAIDIDIIEDFVARFGASRLTFGTDQYSPGGLLGRRVNPILPRIVASQVLSDTDKELILAGNVRALLGLSAPVLELEPAAT
jgi:predicted TIM-barrel fold metal-dependent hydrolase